MSVCPDAYLKNYGPNFIQFSLYLSVAVAGSSHCGIPHTPICTFWLVDDVMFLHNGFYGVCVFLKSESISAASTPLSLAQRSTLRAKSVIYNYLD